MLDTLRTDGWRRGSVWLRVLGIGLLLVAFFVPLSAALVLAIAIPGLLLFLLGSLVWLARTKEPWLRRGA